MRMILIGGAPGVGKTSMARELLGLMRDGATMTQWVDVDALWAHQPWRVDATTTTMLRANLRAVFANAAAAGVDLLLVTWVFQDTSFHKLISSVAPPGIECSTVQLLASELVWRHRFTADPHRPDANNFFFARYTAAQNTPTDYTIDTDNLDAAATARAVAAAVGIPDHA